MNKTNIVLFHHRADSDGLLSGAIAEGSLRSRPDTKVTVVPWDYGDPIPDVLGAHEVWMVDISVDDLLARPDLREYVCIIDHHKTVIEKWGKYADEFKLWKLDTNFAACRLVAAHFGWMAPQPYTLTEEHIQTPHPEEHPLVFTAGLRDVWKHEGTEHEARCNHMELGIRALWPPDFQGFFRCPQKIQEDWMARAVERGATIETYAKSQAMEACERGAMLVEHDGHRFLCLNTLMRGSKVLDDYSRKVKDTVPHDALMVWGVSSKRDVVLSMYHASHRKDLDLSGIARAWGGGGHAGACGARMPLAKFAEILKQ